MTFSICETILHIPILENAWNINMNLLELILSIPKLSIPHTIIQRPIIGDSGLGEGWLQTDAEVQSFNLNLLGLTKCALSSSDELFLIVNLVATHREQYLLSFPMHIIKHFVDNMGITTRSLLAIVLFIIFFRCT